MGTLSNSAASGTLPPTHLHAANGAQAKGVVVACLFALAPTTVGCSVAEPVSPPCPTRLGIDAAVSFAETESSIAGTSTTTTETTSLGVDGIVGHRFGASSFEPGVLLAYTWTDVDSDVVGPADTSVSRDALLLGANLRYWFTLDGTLLPWVEGAAGLLWSSTTSDSEYGTEGHFFRAAIGASSFFSDRVSIDFGVRLELTAVDSAGWSPAVATDSTDITTFLGISTFF